MSRVLIYLQTGHDQEPMLALAEHVDVLAVLRTMVRREDGANGTLDTFVKDGLAENEGAAVLYYLGLENEAAALARYDGSTTYINAEGTEVLLMIRPVPQDGQVVGLWTDEEGE